ncbi:sigma-54-dependent Fis family transcriptional regulator [Desulforegula conservatrix]|uniref:sigma-54-dependent Fis family transcriptional regulator n=1 Tax=Desulforegula conservatrix TaxID=153026 RepID=UPI0004213450|nr:sigma-54-dependent Fis family transcriptional regulator [Desulforegula conservatrix]
MNDPAIHEMLQGHITALLFERDELKGIIETLEDGFIETDLKGNTTRFNKAFCELCGYPPKETPGLSYRTYMDKENAENVYSTFNKVYKSGIPNKAFDYEIIRKDGTKRNVEISIAVLKDSSGIVNGFRCIMRDVTKRKKAEAEIIRQRNSLAAIFRSVDDAIITVDLNLDITEINEAAGKICGIPSDSKGKGFLCLDNSVCGQTCRNVIEETLKIKKPIRNHLVTCGRFTNPMQRVSMSCTPLEDHNGCFIGAVLVIRDITRLMDLEQELKKRDGFHQMIGKSREMQNIYRLIEDISDYEATVLITGESGTGKELVARAIHNSGNRSFKPFVTVNCSALAENLLESELFGHVKGAFTGAVRDHVGRFQAADGGTILLDEIGDISPVIQLKLLRVLQEKEFEKVGDSRSVKVDVRVIACTHKDLKEKVRRGEFREDLYYRLKVLEIKLPPLRDRLDDLPLLIDHFISVYENRFRITAEGVNDDVICAFMNYKWPGNIRELEHAIERAIILGKGSLISLSHIPAEIKTGTRLSQKPESVSMEHEVKDILEALEKTGWNKAKAARILGISRKTLYKKIIKHNLSFTA